MSRFAFDAGRKAVAILRGRALVAVAALKATENLVAHVEKTVEDAKRPAADFLADAVFETAFGAVTAMYRVGNAGDPLQFGPSGIPTAIPAEKHAWSEPRDLAETVRRRLYRAFGVTDDAETTADACEVAEPPRLIEAKPGFDPFAAFPRPPRVPAPSGAYARRPDGPGDCEPDWT